MQQRYEVYRIAKGEYSVVDNVKEGNETQWRYRSYAEALSDARHFNWMWNTEEIEGF